MRKFFWFLVLLIIVAVGGLLVAPNFIPASAYKGRIADAATAATGRDVAINGDVRLAFLPRFELVAEDVTVANAPGGQAEHLAAIGALGIGLELLPLLSGDVQVNQFVLSNAELNLEENVNGKANWDFEADADAAEAAANQGVPTEGGGDAGGGGYRVQHISFSDVRMRRKASG